MESKQIKDKSSFLKLLNTEDKLIVFCFHSNSPSSIIASEIVEEWAKQFIRIIFQVNITTSSKRDQFFLEWLSKQEKIDWRKTGIMTKNKLEVSGEICWIANRKVVGFESIYSQFTMQDLEQRTIDVFEENLNKEFKMENQDRFFIEIICPNCKQKALFFPEYVVRNYKGNQPGQRGKMSCGNCGRIQKKYFTKNDYYYKVPIGNRYLYARTLENFKGLRDYFKNNERLKGSPECDFPKVFYQKRLELVKKMKRIIEEEST